MPEFTIEVSVEGYEPAQGTAASKRAAQQVAAQAFLARRTLADDGHD